MNECVRSRASGSRVAEPQDEKSADIHPDYHPIKVVMTDGTEFNLFDL